MQKKKYRGLGPPINLPNLWQEPLERLIFHKDYVSEEEKRHVRNVSEVFQEVFQGNQELRGKVFGYLDAGYSISEIESLRICNDQYLPKVMREITFYIEYDDPKAFEKPPPKEMLDRIDTFLDKDEWKPFENTRALLRKRSRNFRY